VLALAAPLVAKEEPPLSLPKGARVAVVNLLAAEVQHFHETKSIREAFLKTDNLNWSVPDMLYEALKDPATVIGLTLVPLIPSEELTRVRESCFIESGFNRNLPKDCVVPFNHLLNNEHLQAVIVLSPGLNNSLHAGSARRKELPETLRGWGFGTGEAAAPDGNPSLFNMTEMLLVAPGPEGAALRAHQWGGSFTLEWSNYVPPPDLKTLTSENYAQLQPLFQGLLTRQAARLMEQVKTTP
jgi:hypothetical protein